MECIYIAHQDINQHLASLLSRYRGPHLLAAYSLQRLPVLRTAPRRDRYILSLSAAVPCCVWVLPGPHMYTYKMFRPQ